MGIVGFDLGLYLKAVESFERVLILDPTHAEAYFNKGLALEELGRLNEALIDYDRALIFKSDHIGALARKTNLKHSLSK
jgi:tetratricopeptide (TPR) repeat protein